MAKENTGKKFAIGAIIGAIAGLVTGLLTAPKSGKETREDIKEGVAKARVEAEKRLKVLLKELQDKSVDFKKLAAQTTGKASKELAELVGKAETVMARVRETLSGLHDGDADDSEVQKAIKEAEELRDKMQKLLNPPKKDEK